LELRGYQSEVIDACRDAFRAVGVDGKFGFRNMLLVLPTGAGKCLAKGTPILMFDGSIKPVEDVRVGNLLMGPDSGPRVVSSLARGREEMFRVTPVKGDPYTVNRSHILSLKMTGSSRTAGNPDKGAIVNLTVDDYLSRSKTFRHCAKGWRIGVEFQPHSEAPAIDPYFLGLWLGDGTSRHATITTGDQETVEAVYGYAESLGMRVREEDNSGNSKIYHLVPARGFQKGRGYRSNPIKKALHGYGLLRNKHVPHRYLTGSREERLQVLAGIMDTDGSMSHNGFDLCLKSERLIDDTIFLARSLGFAAYKSPCRRTCCNNGVVGDYFRCGINGDVSEIPCRIERKQAGKREQKKNTLVHGISLESVGEGDYFGFTIEGPDRLFLLGDFTVTHNTVCFADVSFKAAAHGTRVLVLAHRTELIKQASAKLTARGVPHGVIADGYPLTDHAVQVASVQTLALRLHHPYAQGFGLIIIDEAHHAVAPQYLAIIAANPRARVLGVTATPERLDGRGLGRASGGPFDGIVVGPSVAWLQEKGYLCRAKIFAPPGQMTGPDLKGIAKNAGDYARGKLAAAMMGGPRSLTGDAVDHYRRRADGKPAIAYCVSVAHAKDVAEAFRAAGYRAVAVSGDSPAHERAAAIGGLETGAIQVLCAADLISEGLDVPRLECVILLRPTASLTLFLQQVGRALRVADGKDFATILDHAGNTWRFGGGPDMERTWSLNGRPKGGKKPMALKQCPNCYCIHPPAPQCMECGHEYAAEAVKKPKRTLKVMEGELVEFVPDDATPDARARIEARRARIEAIETGHVWQLLERAKNYDDLLLIAKVKGYKPGWLYRAAQEKGFLRRAA
jgi:superfamily II DNA or RNA helicase